MTAVAPPATAVETETQLVRLLRRLLRGTTCATIPDLRPAGCTSKSAQSPVVGPLTKQGQTSHMLAEAKTYRDIVRAVVDETIRTMLLTLPIHRDHCFWVILMGIEHQQIHIETSPVIMRRLPSDCDTPGVDHLSEGGRGAGERTG